MSKTAKIATITCAFLIVAIGVTCLSLGLTGYFNFEDPCVELKSFTIDSVDQSSEGSGGILGALTGGLIPSQIEIEASIVFEVNNTNVFDLDYEQGDEGVIAIPAEETPLNEDLVVGSWTVEEGTLKKRAVNEIPIKANILIDLAGPGAAARRCRAGPAAA